MAGVVDVTLSAHPLADLIPVMSAGDFAALKDDIAANGQAEPIWLYEGKVLDGRHRARACEELEIEPHTQEYDGTEAAKFVLSMNVHRRHLTTAQRALIAKAAMAHFKEAAKARQGEYARVAERDERGHLEPSSGTNAQTRDYHNGNTRARDEAAALAGVSGKTVGQLERVEREAPDLYEHVANGAMTVSRAETQVKQRLIAQQTEPRTQRQTDRANAHRERVDQAVTRLGTHAQVLEELNLNLALEAADEQTVSYWVKTAQDAARRLRGFRVRLEVAQ